MAKKAPTASLFESMYFNLVQVIPNLLQGLFTKRRRWVGFFTRINSDARVVHFCRRLKKKYASDVLWIRVLTRKALLLFDPESVRHVLDHSPQIFGPPGIKKKGMGYFQPEAVTISVGEEWQRRRRWNEAVLDSGQILHRHAESFYEIVRSEVDHTRRHIGEILSWEALADLFERIALAIIFGERAAQNPELARRLTRLMRRSNFPLMLGRSSEQRAFFRGLSEFLENPEPRSLMERASEALTAESTAIEGTEALSQVPHFLFAMKDTLAVNTARALALITSHPEVEGKVRDEMARADLQNASGIADLRYLGGCVQEAMRLWPTTPMLSREALADDVVSGFAVRAGTQILILNTFHHRDPETVTSADAIQAERFRNEAPDFRFNHLSNGPQVCAGFDLALFLARAVLTSLLAEDRYSLERPQLDPARPLPYMLDYFALSWRRATLRAS